MLFPVADDAEYFRQLRENPPEELMDILDEFHTGQPKQKPTPEGLAKLRQRITYLEEQRRKLLDNANPLRQRIAAGDPDSTALTRQLDDSLRDTDADLTRARDLLVKLRLQFEGRN
jgi:ABC-type transporter Mla subunit MlaD